MKRTADYKLDPYCQMIEKPWGYEILLTDPRLPYVGKLAFTKAGKRWSFQYHDLKTETITLLEGEAIIWLEDNKNRVKKIKMIPKKGYFVAPYQKHRFCAITDCLSVEHSTPEKGNTVRLEDDYTRNTETESIRSLPNRGWYERKTAQKKQ